MLDALNNSQKSSTEIAAAKEILRRELILKAGKKKRNRKVQDT